MGYVDLRGRDGRMRKRVDPPSPAPSSTIPLLAAALGLVLAWLVVTFLFEDSLLAIVVVLAFVLGAFLMNREGWRPEHKAARPQIGGEKQLLMALRDLGGITPVEAALETSLSVDEAEEILTRLAERGHLCLESRGDALVYVLPDRDRTS